jgi:hypothetical protein
MLAIMYTISRSKIGGPILKCKNCLHVERVSGFDDNLGSRRTQAASAMLKHVRNDHGTQPMGFLTSQIIERRY